MGTHAETASPDAGAWFGEVPTYRRVRIGAKGGRSESRVGPKDDEDTLPRSAAAHGGASSLADRVRAEQRSQVYLAEAQRLSHTGSFGWRPSTGEIIWSDETFRIFQYDRATALTIERVLQRVHPED